MTWLEWSAAMVDALAWPLAAVVVAIIFRKHVLNLVPRLRSLALRGVQAEFGEGLAEAERAVGEDKQLPGPGEVRWAERAPFTSSIELATAGLQYIANPGGFVDQAWRDLRQDLVAALREEGYSGRLTKEAIREHLVEAGRLPSDSVDVLETLEELRGLAVENPSALDADSVKRFRQLSDKVRRPLRSPSIATEEQDSEASE